MINKIIDFCAHNKFLVLLFIGADLLIIYIWRARRKLRLPGAAKAQESV